MSQELLQSTWSDDVANDPKHRPQSFDRPSTTVRREWCRRPQEAHIAEGNKYRRLSVDEIAVIQGFDPQWVSLTQAKENDRIAAIGNAVAPPVARAISGVLNEERLFQSRTLIEICAGIGGLSGAFDYLAPLAKIEMWDVACDILRSNKAWDPACVVEGKAQDFNYKQFIGKVGLLCGGPPCQPWSQAGQKKGASDPRDVMGFTPVAVSECEPDVFLFENVPGLITSKQHQHYLKDLLSRLKQPRDGLNYGLSYAILNAADYGVPQVRRRVFILGIKNASNTRAAEVMRKIQERATHHDSSKPAIGKKPWVTLRQALVSVNCDEPWRRWNVKASEGKDFIVDEEDAKRDATPLLKQIVQPRRDSDAAFVFDRIAMHWPCKELQLTFENDRWRFVEPTGLMTKRSLMWKESLGKPRGIKHFVVDGDYPAALDALAPCLQGDARVIYFDAPRRDVFSANAHSGYQDSTWLSLVLATARSAARNLAHNGFFVLQVEEDLAHYGRMVLDEVFGFESHVTTLAWQKKYGPQSDRLGPTDAFDYLIVYSKCHKDNIERVGTLQVPDDIVDDGDWRGCFTAGHKGARSGSEATKFKVNAPPYRWSLVSSNLPKGRYRFDGITGVLWFEEVEGVGDFYVDVEVTDSKGSTDQQRVSFKIESPDAGHPKESNRIWWLLKNDNDIKKGGKLRVSGAQSTTGYAGAPFSLVLRAEGGVPFTSEKDAPGPGRFWEFSSRTLINAISQCAAYFGSKGTALPSCKTFHDRADSRKIKSVLNVMPWHDFGKSEDATRHLRALADQGIGSKEIDATAKPESMLSWLLTLFAPRTDDIIVSIGDSNASMAATAIKTGRRAVHLIGPLTGQKRRWEATGKPRLAAVIDGLDKGGVSEAVGLQSNRDHLLEIHSLSNTTLSYDGSGSVLSISGSPDESLADFYAGCLGCTLPASEGWYTSVQGAKAYVLSPEDILDHVMLTQVVSAERERIYVVYERSELDGAAIPANVRLVRAPFDFATRGA